MHSTKKLIGSAWLQFIPNPGCCAPSLSLALGHRAHLHILDGGDRSPLGQCPTWLGNQVHTHRLSLTPLENSWTEGVTLGMELWAMEQRAC